MESSSPCPEALSTASTTISTSTTTTTTPMSSPPSSPTTACAAPCVAAPATPTIHTLFPQYQDTASLDRLRETEYSYLDEQDHLYLDFTGSGLAAKSQHQAHQARVAAAIFGNPHSANPSSEASTQLVDRVRARVLSHLNADAKEYVVVFTANATAAARLVAESYPFTRRGRFVLTADNHNSVNGIREFARKKRAATVYVPVRAPELRVDTADVLGALAPRKGGFLRSLMCGMRGCSGTRRNGLFAFPAQSNFSGVRHPLDWVPMAQDRGYDVLLDAAAYLPTSPLDLSVVKPEFVIASWYKVFGYPTGVGCLVARKDALARLNRPWFAGGTVTAVAVTVPWHSMEKEEAAWEDGTTNFLSIPDVQVGLDHVTSVGMPTIQSRVHCLTGYCLHRMRNLTHSSGRPLFEIYGPQDSINRGGTIAFNVCDEEGKWVDERLVEREASAVNISLRTGCFCNPGAGEAAFGLDLEKVNSLRRYSRGQEVNGKTTHKDDFLRMVGLPTGGAIRISFGLVSNQRDVDRFIAWAEKTYKDRITGSEELPPR